ncbi:hypothetical protein M569_13148 [Genlisea aurea]|uniref:Uncharacterized protein n=1 Tax=Genlisea aurea TaxID=192259 RepID=S8DPE8_9LAMI|nr:hypothetical protein M569_13148 [Genlisea aurea]
MEPIKTTPGATPSSSAEIPGETLQMAMALQALPWSERRFLAAFLTSSSASSSAAPTPTLEKPEKKEKADEKPLREGTEQVSVGGTVTKATAETGVRTSSNEQEKEGVVSAKMVAEPAGDIPAETSARLVEHLRAVPFATPSAETEKSSEPRRDETESVGINLEKSLPTRLSQRILRSQSQTGKGGMTDYNSDEKSSSAGDQPEEEEDKDSESRTVHKGKKTAVYNPTPLSSVKRIKIEGQKEEELIYRIDWGALDELKIRDEVEAYLTDSNMMELVNPRGEIDTEHTRMFYSSVRLTRYHDLDDVCMEFRLGGKMFIRTLRQFAVESGLATEEEAGSEKFDEYEMRWGDKFNPHKAYQRLTGVAGQWNKSKSVNKELTDQVMGYIQFLIAYNLTGRTRNYFIPTKFELWLLDNIKAGKKINPATVAYHTIEMAKKRGGDVITNFAMRAGLPMHEEAMMAPGKLSLALMEKHAVIRKPERGPSAIKAGKKKQSKSVDEEEAEESGGCTGEHSKGCQKCEWAEMLFMVKEMYISSHRKKK